MKRIQDVIDDGLAAHGRWKQLLKSAATGGKAEVTVADAAKDHVCPFGKWLHGDAAALTAAEQGTDLERVRQLHRQFHRVAGETLAAALRGDRARYDADVALDGRFARASIELMTGLNAWKGRLVAGR